MLTAEGSTSEGSLRNSKDGPFYVCELFIGLFEMESFYMALAGIEGTEPLCLPGAGIQAVHQVS